MSVAIFMRKAQLGETKETHNKDEFTSNEPQTVGHLMASREPFVRGGYTTSPPLEDGQISGACQQ